MKTSYKLHSQFCSEHTFFHDIIENYNSKGTDYGNQQRNSLKLFNFKDTIVNVKSFKIPNIINQITYRFFRKSKAQRSFEYACKLQKLKIGTPQPIGYFEYQSFFLFSNSYYISEQLDCDLTFRELTTDFNYPDHENILRAFTRFTFELHEKGIHFLDHSPGNTLIKKNKLGEYLFYLVDLNRMEFKPLDFKTRMKNFARLTKHSTLINTMSDEYAKISGLKFNSVNKSMLAFTNEFQQQRKRKKEIKRTLKFWKK